MPATATTGTAGGGGDAAAGGARRMPPKKKGGGAKGGAKAKDVQARVKKAVVDKTFGMKNKKGKKAQQFIEEVKRGAATAGMSSEALRRQRREKEEAAAARAAKKEKAAADAEFRKMVAAAGPKLAPGQDPKTVVCAFYKAGNCIKGAKCKYSHDLGVERKVAKKNLYVDERKEEGMDDWDQEQLEKAVNAKPERENATDIICKYFLDAIEQRKYGYFWHCPNGNDTCMYRHRLPIGFVLKTKEDEAAAREGVDDGLLLMESIEEERKRLDMTKCTPLTKERFYAWKKARAQRKKKEVAAEAAKSTKDKKARNMQMSGRALFKFDPSMFVDDDEAQDDDEGLYERQPESDDEAVGRDFTNYHAVGFSDSDDDDDESASASSSSAADAAVAAVAAAGSGAKATGDADATGVAAATDALGALDANLFAGDEELPSDSDDDAKPSAAPG